MKNITYFLTSLLIVLSFGSQALADDSVLSVRQLPDQTYEAVLSLDSTICVQVNPASSVQVVGSEILIESPSSEQLPCIFIPPIVYYEVTALIGELAPGNYTVTWSQPGAFSWSISYLVRSASPIPSSSLWSLLLLIVGVLVFVRQSFYSRTQLKLK
ncbi:MAG: hypothetical protein KJO60_04680 [Desulfofustis sp.]|nr:hypothetical protein [Desulfofustis sp.]NNK98496.1 hypothetical protein [Xanthomonadales bacterium]